MVCPGVYVIYAFLDVLNNEKKLVYIGKSDDLRRRISSHPLKKLFSDNGIKTDFKLKISETPEILERSLIHRLNPILNFQYTNKSRQELYINGLIEEMKAKIRTNQFVFYIMLMG